MDPDGVRVCDAGHRFPELVQIIRTFGLDEGNVLCVYVCGSHLLGTCHKRSDWDMVIIVEKLSGDKPVNAHKGQLEAFIVSKSDYTAMLRAHSMQVMITLWLPRGFILKEEFQFRTQFRFEQEALMASLSSTKERDLRVAQKHFVKSNHVQGKKVVFHLVSYLLLSSQVKRLGSIADYTCVLQYRDQIMDDSVTSWDEFLLTVEPIVHQLWASLTAVP
eukprot:Em0023g206a